LHASVHAFVCLSVSASMRPILYVSTISPVSIEEFSSNFFRDVTDSKSESDGIRHFILNPKSIGYLKSNRDGFMHLEIFVSVHVYNYFRK